MLLRFFYVEDDAEDVLEVIYCQYWVKVILLTAVINIVIQFDQELK